MSTFDGQDLFGSGPHRFEVPALEVRMQRSAAAGADGVRVSTAGLAGREIAQSGVLTAASAAGLQTQVDAIRGVMDGRVGTLVDHLGLAHPNVSLVSFRPRGAMEVGRLYSLRYEARYVEVS